MELPTYSYTWASQFKMATTLGLREVHQPCLKTPRLADMITRWRKVLYLHEIFMKAVLCIRITFVHLMKLRRKKTNIQKFSFNLELRRWKSSERPVSP